MQYCFIMPLWCYVGVTPAQSAGGPRAVPSGSISPRSGAPRCPLFERFFFSCFPGSVRNSICYNNRNGGHRSVRTFLTVRALSGSVEASQMASKFLLDPEGIGYNLYLHPQCIQIRHELSGLLRCRFLLRAHTAPSTDHCIRA